MQFCDRSSAMFIFPAQGIDSRKTIGTAEGMAT